MKKSFTKLVLRVETVRVLHTSSLTEIIGGARDERPAYIVITRPITISCPDPIPTHN